MSKLNQPTPKENTFLWKLASFVYAFVILINENLNLIDGLGLNERTSTIIKIIGAFSYMIFTFFNFSKIPKNKYE